MTLFEAVSWERCNTSDRFDTSERDCFRQVLFDEQCVFFREDEKTLREIIHPSGIDGARKSARTRAIHNQSSNGESGTLAHA